MDTEMIAIIKEGVEWSIRDKHITRVGDKEFKYEFYELLRVMNHIFEREEERFDLTLEDVKRIIDERQSL
jgi:hypothetical protein